MKSIALAAAGFLAALSTPALAQGTPAAASAPSCYIEVRSLMAPTGIADLGAAIRALDTALRPQVVEINAVKTQIARLEQRDQAPVQSTSIEAAFADEDAAPRQAAPAVDNRTAQEIDRLQTDLEAKQAQLKLDYAAQQKALVGPVQERINRGAQSFATTSGCTGLKMARTADLAALTTAGARNVTGDFVAWFSTNPPA